MTPNTVAIVLNAKSGKQNSTTAQTRITAGFERHGTVVKFFPVGEYESIAAATKAALKAVDGPIIAAGGDGTISGVAGVMRDHDRALGIIPLGTFNYFARSLQIPEDIAGAVDVVLEGETKSVAVATINGQSFLNNASIGAYPAILQTREGIYRRWGRSRVAAYWSVIKALATFRSALRLDISVDGNKTQLKTPLVFAINNAFQLSQMGLAGQDCISNGKMVVLVAPDAGRWGLLKHAIALAFGTAKRKTDYDMLCGSEIVITMKRKRRAVACDGEISRMDSPLVLRRGDNPMKVIVPTQVETQVR